MIQNNRITDPMETLAAEYLNEGRTSWSPKTTCRKLGTFRSYGKWLGQPALLAAYRPPTPAKPQPHPIPEGIEGVDRMIQRTRNPLHKALLALNGLMGLRIDEVIQVRPDHFNLSERTLKIRGKGDKTRVIPVSDKAWTVIKDRFEVCQPGNLLLVPYTNSGARKAVSRHGRNAGLQRHVVSHDLRATALTAFYRNTKDIRAVQEIAGHADTKTTMTYTLVDIDAMREAVNL